VPHSRGRGSKPNLRLENILADEARFIKSWFDNPLLTGAVSPSGPALAQMMARAIDLAATGPIIELGPGTGAITQALLDRGIEAARLVLVEFDEKFCRLLEQRFPGVRVVRGDAYDLGRTLGNLLDQPIAAVVSSLPLLNKPEHVRHALLAHAFELMAPDGVFVQFTYSFNSPIPRKAPSIAFEAEASPRIWLNLPPARVWIYRRPGTSDRSRGRGERSVFRPLKSNEKRRPQFGVAFDAAKSQVRTFIRDLFTLPSERPLKPARALLRKLPEIEE
jgi:phosphatidylethanolamine/phosphatidyl-N-methylethanolamine N-methyltransferase